MRQIFSCKWSPLLCQKFVLVVLSLQLLSWSFLSFLCFLSLAGLVLVVLLVAVVVLF